MEVSREHEAVGSGVEEALEEPNFVGLRPYPVEFEGGRAGTPAVGGGERVVGEVRGIRDRIEIGKGKRGRGGRRGRGGGVEGLAFDGKLGSRGFKGWDMGGVHG